MDFSDLKQEQKDSISLTLKKKNVILIVPTGFGKSLCFQLPSCTFPLLTLVFSPLNSLMKDQVQSLVNAGVAAAFLNSTLTEVEQILIVENIKSFKILYVTPERFSSMKHRSFFSNLNGFIIRPRWSTLCIRMEYL